MKRSGNWKEIYLKLLKAEQKHALEPSDLETLALAAYLTGRDAESFEIVERAHLGHLQRKNMPMAVRCAFWLGLMLMNKGERARSSGWFSRGERLLGIDKVPDCAEKGLLLIPKALRMLYSNHASKAQELFEQAAIIGEQFEDVDLISLGRLGHGQAMIQQGNVAKGIKLLDESMITVETEKVSPLVKGIVYCAVIETCRKVWDLRRAQEWTAALTNWCDTQPDMMPFRGQCLVRKAEILQFQGYWHQALKETQGACELLTRPPGEPAAGEAFYRRAELHRLLGDYQKAKNCYAEAAKWGRKPQPGMAILRLAQGQNKAAETSIVNTLKETTDPMRRAELLPEVVNIMISGKQPEKALEAAKELYGIAKQFDVPFLHATSSYCQGAVFLAKENIQPALEQLQKALVIWNELHLPYESARTRELMGLVYRALDDRDNSEIELAAAKWVFEQLKAMPDLKRIKGLINIKSNHQSYGLTLRELQVLRRVASGKTNKAVAGELFISRRTVDRHVSNIYNKLGVSSRAEATSFTLKNKILDIDLFHG